MTIPVRQIRPDPADSTVGAFVSARGSFGKWAARGTLALLAVTLFSFLAANGAQAAVPTGSLKPFLNCYWDNGDNTVTVSIGVTSSNAGDVNVYVGADNRVTQGAPDRGQPETFANGTRNNVWSFTVSYTEINAGINWQLSGNSVAVDAVNQCSTKPQMAMGSNGIAFLAFGALTTTIGGYFLNGRSSRRRTSGIA
jgi:hypothetical protein